MKIVGLDQFAALSKGAALPVGTVRKHGQRLMVKVSDRGSKDRTQWKPFNTSGYTAKYPGRVVISREKLQALLKRGTYSIISAGRNGKDANEAKLSHEDPKFAERHEKLRRDLVAGGFHYIEGEGDYGDPEPSFIVFHKDTKHPPERPVFMVPHASKSEFAKIRALGKRHNQESVIHVSNGRNEMHYTTGSNAGKFVAGGGYEMVPGAKSYYTKIVHRKHVTKFTLGFDFSEDHAPSKALLKSGKKHVLTIGPRGGKIVGYGPGHKPIYEHEAGATTKAKAKKGKKAGAKYRLEKWMRVQGHPAGRVKVGDIALAGGVGGAAVKVMPRRKGVRAGSIVVRNMVSGKEHIVRQDTVFLAQPRPVKKAPPRKKAPVKAKPPKRKKRAPIVAKWDPKSFKRKTPVFPGSRAKKGTILSKLETGAYPLGVLKKKDRKGFTVRQDKIFMPDADVQKLIEEMTPLARSIAKKFGQQFHAKKWAVGERPEGKGPYPDLEDAAWEGLAQALDTYQGEHPFIPHVQAYMKNAVALRARQESSMFSIPYRLHRAYGKFLSADARVRSTLAATGVDREPTATEIARRWTVKKREVTGTAIGGPQANDPLPMGDWKMRKKVGKKWVEVETKTGQKHGRVWWVGQLLAIKDADRKVRGSDFLDEMAVPGGIIPTDPRSPFTAALSTTLGMRDDMEEAVDRLTPKSRTIIRMRFGFHSSSGKAATSEEIAAKLSIKSEGPRNRGKELSVRRKMDLLPGLLKEANKELRTVLVFGKEYQELRAALPELARRLDESEGTKSAAQIFKEVAEEQGRIDRARRRRGTVLVGGRMAALSDLTSEPFVERPDREVAPVDILVSHPETGASKTIRSWSVGDKESERPITTEEIEEGIRAGTSKHGHARETTRSNPRSNPKKSRT